MAPTRTSNNSKLVLETPEPLFDEYGHLIPGKSDKTPRKRADGSLTDVSMDLEVSRVECVRNTDDHELDYGDGDDEEMENADGNTLPSGSSLPTEDGADEPHPSFLKYETPQASKKDPMRGGGIVLEPVSTKVGRMCAHREVRAMALEGADAEDERKLLRHIQDKKWMLNENLYMLECRGEEFDPDKAMNPDEFEALKCDICEEYARHVGDDFARGDRSLKAVIQLRELYMLADAKIDNRQAEKSIRLLEVVNAVAEQLSKDKERQIEAAKAEKSLAVQEVGRLGAKLEASEKKLDEAWDEIKFLEDKITELDALVDNLAFPELPHKNARRHDEGAQRKMVAPVTPAAVRNSEDVVMNEVESVTTKEPLSMDNGTPSLSTNVALVDRLMGAPVEGTSDEAGPPRSLLSNVTVFAPPMLETEAHVDERGFPTDVATADAVVKLLNTGKPYYVYVFRMFYLWAFCRAIRPADRTPAQQRAINMFCMFNWFANMLTTVSQDLPAQRAALRYFHALRREDIGYNPTLLAQLIQFREWTDVRGCPFADDAWTLNMRRVRGLNLLEALTLHRSTNKPDDQTRNYQAQLEKAFMELFCKPGLYKKLLERHGMKPAALFAARRWDETRDGVPNPDTVMVFFADCGVSTFMIDDAFEFGQQLVFDWTEKSVKPLGWTPEELTSVQHQPDWGKPPRGLFPPINDLFPRRPDLPWVHHADQFILTKLSEWQHPELVGMKRAPGSKIQSHAMEQVNLFCKDERRRINEAATAHASINAGAGTSHSGLPAALANRRTSGMLRGGRTQKRAGDAIMSSNPPAVPLGTFHDPHPASFTANMDNFNGFADALAQAGLAPAPPFQYGETEYDSNVVMDGWSATHISTEI
ncbi:hypothetical protein DFH09DRAFT_1108871 [Mycena vulgaris]|nr:hypothetical protein DFH09DRAFT_1108871 [Mycena vulgaris]